MLLLLEILAIYAPVVNASIFTVFSFPLISSDSTVCPKRFETVILESSVLAVTIKFESWI